MGKTLSPKNVSLSLALVVGIFSLVCALLVAIVPDMAFSLFGSIFHGLDISQISKSVSLGNALLGTVLVAIIALIAGWLYAVIYNRLN